VFTANPEDYTARGKIITPLKDRIGSEIRTHYPLTLEQGLSITKQDSWVERTSPIRLEVPNYIREIVEQLAFLAREDKRVDKRSGVSQRLPISALENVISNAERRALKAGAAALVVGLLCAAVVAYGVYLRMQPAFIPVTAAVHNNALLISWPSTFTRDAEDVTVRVNDGLALSLPPSDRISGTTTITNASGTPIERIRAHGRSRGANDVSLLMRSSLPRSTVLSAMSYSFRVSKIPLRRCIHPRRQHQRRIDPLRQMTGAAVHRERPPRAPRVPGSIAAFPAVVGFG